MREGLSTGWATQMAHHDHVAEGDLTDGRAGWCAVFEHRDRCARGEACEVL